MTKLCLTISSPRALVIAMANDRKSRVIAGMARAGSYYRENLDKFVIEYLGFDFLKWFQLALIVMMDRAKTFLWIAARGMGKSYLTAIYICCRCILYPGTKVVIVSGTRGQAINVLTKIQLELIPRSANLKNEIDFTKTKFDGQYAMIVFKNGSTAKVVTASDNARSNRANLLIVDEFRMVKKDTVDTVLRKFLTSRRMPLYKELTEDEKKSEYAKEPNKECYLSSAYFKDSWAYTKTLDTFRIMLDDRKTDFVCGFPYQLSIQEGLLFPEDVEGEMLESDFNEIKFGMEMEAKFYGSDGEAFFNFESISKNRHIKYPMLPDKIADMLGNSAKVKIAPKVAGEKRILSADIALMRSRKNDNDATAVFINRLVPAKAGRYISNIVYTDTFEGMHTEDQALLIRKMFDEYQCDYIVLDSAGVGLGIFDALVRDITDPETGEVYPAISCCNNPEMAARCTVVGAEKVIWAIKANAQFNSDCAVMLREGFRSGKIRLLETEYEADNLLGEIKGYKSLTPAQRLKAQMPYVNTTLLIDELINLKHEESNGRVRVYEKAGRRKDRFSSLSYNYYVATQLESKLSRRNAADKDFDSIFMFRPPKVRG